MCGPTGDFSENPGLLGGIIATGSQAAGSGETWALWYLEQRDGDVPRIEPEIRIRCENGEVPPRRVCTDQMIHRAALDACSHAGIVILGGGLVILDLHG